VIDFDAYLERIGLREPASLAEIHRAHVLSIPFENLDPHMGTPVSLGPEELERKILRRGRGGYCFEHNMLLKSALDHMGAQVDPFLARVRYGAEPGVVRPRTHLVLRVRTEEHSWLADVGFGVGGLLEPIIFGAGEPSVQSGWRLRLIEDAHELVLQAFEGEGWVDLYGFVPQPVPEVDIETSNWWACTHPRSPFVTGLVVSVQRDDGTRVRLSDWSGLALSERTPEGTTTTSVEGEQVPELLATRFALPGFALDLDGHVCTSRDD
jgi:N-hydroxyarylamine O-acetyltransferase